MIGMIDLNMKFIGFIYVLMLKMKIILQSIDDNHLKVCSIASFTLKYCSINSSLRGSIIRIPAFIII